MCVCVCETQTYKIKKDLNKKFKSYNTTFKKAFVFFVYMMTEIFSILSEDIY